MAFSDYYRIARHNPKLPLEHERKLIALARGGDHSAQSELLSHLYGFFLFRIHTTLYPSVVREHAEDIFHECVLLALGKVHTYHPEYRDEQGVRHPVHMSTYIWKSVTGLMLAHVKRKRECCRGDMANLADC